MLRGPHRDPVLDRVDAEEVAADFLHLAQIAIDVLRAEQRNVQPQMLAEARLHAFAAVNVFLHAAGDDVARCELLLLRFVVRHERFPVDIAQQSAVAAAPLGDQDAGREDGGGMKLDGLHVADGGHARFQRQRGADALADHRVGGRSIEAAGTAAGDRRGFGDIRDEFTGDEIAHDRAVAAARVMDEGQRFHALVHGNRMRDRLVAHRVEHGVARAVGNVAGPPFLGPAEIALRHQAMRFVALGDRDFRGIDDDVAVALLHPAPRHAPGGELAYRLGRRVDEHAHDLLIGAPVAAAHRVLEMHVLVVALSLDHVAEACLHPALCRRRVRALRPERARG